MDDNITNIADIYMTLLVNLAPRDTWNLVNSIGYKVLDDDTVEIIIGGENVQYAPYTNERWDPPVNLDHFPSGRKRTPLEKRSLKSYRTGGQNPNEGWVDRALEQASLLLAEINQGYLVK